MNARKIARVVLASVGLVAFSLGTALAVTLPFSDDFENTPVGYYPNANGWRTWLSGNTAYVSDQAYYSATRSFRLQSYPYWSRCDYVSLDEVPDRLTYQASVYVDPFPGRSAWVGMAHGLSSQVPFHNFFTISSQDGWVGTVDFTGPRGSLPVPVGEFPVGEWVTVQADLDFQALVADVWLDGELAATNIPIQPKEFDDPTVGHLVLNRFAAAECNWVGGGYGVIYLDDVSLSEPPAAVTLEAVVEFDPSKVNFHSRGRWVTCYIEMPDGYSVADIDVASLLVDGSLSPELWPVSIGDHDSDGVPDLMVKFDRSALAGLLAPGSQVISLTGQMLDGIPLAGGAPIEATP